MSTSKSTPIQAKQSEKSVALWEIFMVFFKVGLFTFGGGLVMIPLIQREVTEKRLWMNSKEFVDMLAITNTAPGAFAINTSIYIGYQLRGLLGAVIGALGTIIPSFTVIIVIAYLLIWGKDISWLEKFFAGVRPVVVALILDAGFKLGKKTIKSGFDISLLVLGTLVITFTHIHPALIILSGAILGILYYRGKNQPSEQTQEAKK